MESNLNHRGTGSYAAVPLQDLSGMDHEPSAREEHITMDQFNASNGAGLKSGASTYQHLQSATGSGDANYGNTTYPLQRRGTKSVMKGHYTEIIIALLAVSTPLILSAVLLYLVYNYVEVDDGLAYYTTNRQDKDLGNAYYVNYSATRLVFVSSISSTLSLALLPAIMLLCSYPLAFDLQKRSDANEVSKLPSPYQLELLIRLLGGNMMDLVRYLKYVLGKRKRRVATVPILSNAALALFLTLLLAVLISSADTWLHISTTSVDYTSVQPQSIDGHAYGQANGAPFNPGFGLPEMCLGSSLADGMDIDGCLFTGGGSGADLGLTNATEAYLTLANQSHRSKVYVYNNASILGPADPPPDIDFTATSFASYTSCEMVTTLCNVSFTDPGGSDAARDETFDCTRDKAGLVLAGNWSTALTNPISSSGSISSGPELVVDWTANYQLGFMYYNTSEKTQQGFDYAVEGANSSKLWFGVLFSLPPTVVPFEAGGSDESSQINKQLDVVYLPRGEAGGIMSCTTDLSSVTYDYVNGQFKNAQYTPMNRTAATPFGQAISENMGGENLGVGLVLAASSAKDSGDFAAKFATAYDQTVLGLPAGALLERLALSQSLRTTKLVTRVPRAPFIALIVLDIVLATLGIVLASWAIVLCRRYGVRDVQARLNIGGLVVECFERKDGTDGQVARSVDDLYAERRGMGTGRVAIVRVDAGGRGYVRVGVPAKDDAMGASLGSLS